MAEFKIDKTIRLRDGHKLFCLCLSLILVLFCGHASFANDNIVDNLETKLSQATSDSERLILMDELIGELISVDLKEALIYAHKSLDLSRQIGDRAKEVKALYNMGLVLYETDERSSSLAYFEKSERMAEEFGLGELQAHNLMSIAKYYRYVPKDSTKTVDNFLKSAKVSKAIDFHWGAGRSYAKLASFYTRYNQIDLCEKYLKLAAGHYAKHSNGNKTIAHYYTEVGDKIWDTNPKKSMDLYFKGKEYKLIPNLMVSLAKAHTFIGENEIAFNYLKEAIPYFRKTESRQRMLGITIAQLAEVYINQGDYKAANETCDEGIEMLIHLGRSDQKALPQFYRIKGMILEKEANDKEALRYFKLSIEEAKRIKNSFARINSTLALGMFYSTRDQKESEFYCKQSLKEAKKRKHISLELGSCDCLYNVYKSKGSYLDALNFHENKIRLSDSLNTMTIGHALDVNNKISEKDKLIGEQAYQKKIREKELRNQHILIISLFVIMLFGLLVIGILIKSHRKVRKVNKEINEKTNELLKTNLNLERSNEELERFAHIASHDLKTPVRSIVSFTTLLRKKLENEENPNVTDLLDFIESSGKRMNRLIVDVLEFSQLSGDVTVEKEMIDLNQLTNEIAQLQRTSNSKQVTIQVSELPHLKWFHSRLYLLFKNLIENGIKYNESDHPIIKVYYKNVAGLHSVFIEDNGIGINNEYFDKIFVMFNRLHNQKKYEGSGLGLATCKKIVEEFEGEITITSEVNKGSIFRIDLPDHLIHQAEHVSMVSNEVLE